MRVALVSGVAETRDALSRAFLNAPGTWQLSLLPSPPDDADVLVCGSDSMVDGAILFDPSRPEAALEKVQQGARSEPDAARTYVVTGAGGGSGVTTVALEMCRVLSRDLRCAYLDLDDRQGCAPRLGLPEEHLTWERDGGEVGIPIGGFRVFPSPLRPEPLDRFLESLSKRFERVVIDIPSTRLAAVAPAAGVLVMQPSVPAAIAARRILSEAPETSWAVALNKVGVGGDASTSVLQEHLRRRVSISLPVCPWLRDEADRQRVGTPPPMSRWAARVKRLVTVLEGID